MRAPTLFVLPPPFAEPPMSLPPKLFQPVTVGGLPLAHRVVMAPLTRLRADAAGVPQHRAPAYYAQRAHTPGTLIIAEAAIIAPQAGGVPNAPGMYTEAQIAGWRAVTDAVHAKKCFIYAQLVAVGRASLPEVLAAENFPYVAASAIRLSTRPEGPTPRALSVPEIQEYIGLFSTAAKNAMAAGFDGVEIHGAHGYLIEQFLSDSSNIRTDTYGGSDENRARFVLEVVAAVVRAVGEARTALRISPWATLHDSLASDPIHTFTHLLTSLSAVHPELAYLHVVEPRVDGDIDAAAPPTGASNNFVRVLWKGKTLIRAGGYTRASAIAAGEAGDLVAFGRAFISNPDLVHRLQHDIPLAKGNRATYYGFGRTDAEGYTTYPCAGDAGVSASL